MGEQGELLLRPLGIGEIFDRAVTLFVRNWLAFGIIMAVGVAPSSVCDYLAATSNPAWTAMSKLLELLTVVATIAIGAVVAQVYRRETVDWRSALGTGFSKLLPAIGANLTLILIALLPLLVVVGIPTGLGVFRFANLAEDIVAVLVAVTGGAIVIGLFFAASYTLNAMAIDNYRAMDAVGRALGLFDRAHLARTILFAVAQGTLVLGGGFAAGALAVSIRNIAVATAVEAVLLVIVSGLGNVITSVFYFDVAIRSEGYDLQVALDAMPS